MGNYLAQPNCFKNSGSGASPRVTYAVSSMQGWRVSMEDSHVIYHQFPNTSEAQCPLKSERRHKEELVETASRRMHLFGIFDGHGGPQVARFMSSALIEELEKSPQFQEGNFEIAFKVAYCNLDRILRNQDWPSDHRLLLDQNDGRPLTACTDNGQHTHSMLAGSVNCELCGCIVPEPPPPPRPNPPAEVEEEQKENAPVGVGVVEGGVVADGEGCSNPLPMPAVENDIPSNVEAEDPTVDFVEEEAAVPPAIVEEGGESNTPKSSPQTLVGTFTHGFKHYVSHLLNATSRIGSNFIQSPPNQSGLRDRDYGDYNGRPRRNNSNPAMYAGCTAISALLVDNILYVANAGDSRAVLCRGGRAESLSKDHKPNLPEERQRIYAAGGFVEYGRVNGNLNLSRAIGDLVYKQDMSLPPEKQIVTGYPDVRRIELQPDDEFIVSSIVRRKFRRNVQVMGCDGIWEYFSSQDVVDFVRSRMRRQVIGPAAEQVPSSCSSAEFAPRPQRRGTESLSGANVNPDHLRAPAQQVNHSQCPASSRPLRSQQKSGLAEICLSKTVEELFESLISPNPSLFEYGCDNMTAILIDLRPGQNCACQCHDLQRQVFSEVFPMTRKESGASVTTVENPQSGISDGDKADPPVLTESGSMGGSWNEGADKTTVEEDEDQPYSTLPLHGSLPVDELVSITTP